LDMCHKKKGHHFGCTWCTCNSLCRIRMDEIYNDNVYTCEIQIVVRNYMSTPTCLMQLRQNLATYVACN
jgi:hypothetical protein